MADETTTTETTTQETSPESLMTAAGGQTTETTGTQTETRQEGTQASWLDSFGDGLKDDPSFSKYENKEAFIEGHRNLLHLAGKKGLVRPDDNAPPEVWNEFWTRVGRPEKADGYDWKPGENFAIDEAAFGEAQTKLHGLGLDKQQFAGVMELYQGDIQTQLAKAQQGQVDARAETETSLKQEWGDSYDHKIGMVQALVTKFNMGETVTKLGMGNSKEAVAMFAQLAEELGEDKIVANPQMKLDATAELDTLNKSEAYQNVRHPGHQAAMRRRSELYQKLYPGQS